MSRIRYAIDFGTHKIVWARYELQENSHPLTSGVILNSFRIQNNEIKAKAEDAINGAYKYPDTTYTEYKMALNGDDNTFQKRELTPEKVTELAFDWLLNAPDGVKDMQYQHGSDIAIGVPGHWSTNGSGCKAIENALVKAGVPHDCFHILPEPWAALMALWAEKPESISNFNDNDKILVFDFGGGTLDIAISSAPTDTSEEIDEIVYYDAHVIGGKDFDQKVKSYLSEKIVKRAKVQKLSVKDLGTITKKARHIKSRLSDVDEAFVEFFDLEALPGGYDCTIDREGFLSMCRNEIENIKDAIRKSLSKNSVHAQSIKKVFLSGGTSQMFFIPDMMLDLFKHLKHNDLIKTQNPQKDVVHGLSICYQYGLKNQNISAVVTNHQEIEDMIRNYALGAGTAALLIPIPIVDLLAGVGVNWKMVVDIADKYGKEFDQNRAEALISSIGRCLLGMGILFVISSFLKIAIVGAFLQAGVAGYFTFITGMAVNEYFKNECNWGKSGIDGVITGLKERYPPIDTIKQIARQLKKQQSR